jgi:hypothetical protein
VVEVRLDDWGRWIVWRPDARRKQASYSTMAPAQLHATRVAAAAGGGLVMVFRADGSVGARIRCGAERVAARREEPVARRAVPARPTSPWIG